MQNEKDNGVQQTQGDDFDDIFGVVEDDTIEHTEDSNKDSKENPEKLDKDIEDSPDIKKQDNKNTQPAEPSNEELNQNTETKSPEAEYKAEIEKAERRFKDSQKWGTELKKKLSSYEKAIKKYTDDGVITADEANDLLDHTKFEDSPLEDEPILIKYSRIWDEGIDRMREYADDPKKLDQYVYAFQQLLNDSIRDNQTQDIFDEFSDLEQTPSSYARKVIEIGKRYNEEVFNEIYDAGSIKHYKEKVSVIIKDLNKKLDNAKEKIEEYKKKYEDFDPEPNQRFPTRGNVDSSSHKKNSSKDVLDEVFSELH